MVNQKNIFRRLSFWMNNSSDRVHRVLKLKSTYQYRRSVSQSNPGLKDFAKRNWKHHSLYIECTFSIGRNLDQMHRVACHESVLHNQKVLHLRNRSPSNLSKWWHNVTRKFLYNTLNRHQLYDITYITYPAVSVRKWLDISWIFA